MTDTPPPEKPPAEPVLIRPAPFRSQPGGSAATLRRVIQALAAALLFACLCGLLGTAWFVFTAQRVAVRIDPPPDSLRMSGGLLTPRIGDHYLLRPGAYTLEAGRSCYRDITHRFEVGTAEGQVVRLAMEKLPGRLRISAHRRGLPAETVRGAQVLVDGRVAGETPVPELELPQGRSRIEIRSERYRAPSLEVEVEGCGRLQDLDVALTPAGSPVTIRSVPDGAAVMVDGAMAGSTPLQVELAAGAHDVEVRAERHKPWRERIEVADDQPLALPEIRLEPADGRLVIRSSPPGASVVIGRRYAGQTPLDVDLPPGKEQKIQLSKAGHETQSRTATVGSGEALTIEVALRPIEGTVALTVDPADAELVVDGQPRGKVPRELRLTAVEHEIEIRKEGYEPFRSRITPRPGHPQELKAVLKRPGAPAQTPAEAALIRAANGYELTRIKPGEFSMGSSRREQGRRSNEILRRVRLVRPFYMGLREITNREFREFQRDHRSGSFASRDLNADDLPAVMVAWEQAALFCNWLSLRQGLPPVYEQRGGRVVAADPLGPGYRLPTEAEWEFCAGAGGAVKYPWGDGYPPGKGAGNYADESAKGLLEVIVEGYNDGYPAAAPPGTFPANPKGLFDLGGNVAEWCHDVYAIDPQAAQKQGVDPVGPAEGAHRVVKGASWKQAGITYLRIAFRDYSAGGRPDLGFRVSRYAE
jgi:formylglycine-generating enzyme required for sulfatase activity